MKPHEFTVGAKFIYNGPIVEREKQNEVIKVDEGKVHPKHGTWFWDCSPYAQDCELIQDGSVASKPNNTPRMYSEEEVFTLANNAFYAGRERVNGTVFKFDTYTDYVNSKLK